MVDLFDELGITHDEPAPNQRAPDLFDELGIEPDYDSTVEGMGKAAVNTPARLLDAGYGIAQAAGEIEPVDIKENGVIGGIVSHITRKTLPYFLGDELDKLSTEDRKKADTAIAKIGGTGEQLSPALAAFGKGMHEQAQVDLEENAPNLNPDNVVGQFAVDATRGVADMAVPMGLGLVKRAMAMPTFLAYAGGSKYSEYRDKGMSPEASLEAGFASMMTEGITEKIPLDILLDKTLPVGKRFLGAALGEGAQEFVADAVEQTYDAKKLEGMTFQEAVANVDWKQALYAAGVGATVGGTLAVPAQVAHTLSKGQSVPGNSQAQPSEWEASPVPEEGKADVSKDVSADQYFGIDQKVETLEPIPEDSTALNPEALATNNAAIDERNEGVKARDARVLDNQISDLGQTIADLDGEIRQKTESLEDTSALVNRYASLVGKQKSLQAQRAQMDVAVEPESRTDQETPDPIVDTAEAAVEPEIPDVVRSKKEQAKVYRDAANAQTDPTIKKDLARQAQILDAQARGESPKLTPVERSRMQRRIDWQSDDLVSVVRKLGGLNTELENDFEGRLSHLNSREDAHGRKVFGLPNIEQKGDKGITLDDLAEQLHQAGWIPRNDQRLAAELLSQAEQQGPVFGNSTDFDQIPEELEYDPQQDADKEVMALIDENERVNQFDDAMTKATVESDITPEGTITNQEYADEKSRKQPDVRGIERRQDRRGINAAGQEATVAKGNLPQADSIGGSQPGGPIEAQRVEGAEVEKDGDNLQHEVVDKEGGYVPPSELPLDERVELERNLTRNTIVGGVKEIARLVAERAKNKGRQLAVRYGLVDGREAARLKAQTGLDLKGYKHRIDLFGVNHIIKKHGNAKREASQGQVAVVPEDFSQIPSIVSTPDNVIKLPGRDKENNEIIRYEKKIDDTYFYVESVRTGRKELAAKTLYKRKNREVPATSGATPVEASFIRPERIVGATQSLDPNVAQSVPESNVSISKADLAQAAANTNITPTDGQIAAGNYKKGRLSLGSLKLTIENPKGSIRKGVDPDGNAWETKLGAHYGDIEGTKGADGDPIDVFLNDADITPDMPVFVIDASDQHGKFDEHKVMLGYPTEQAARSAYLASYQKGWKVGPVTRVNLEGLEYWIKNGDTAKVFDEGSSKNVAGPGTPSAAKGALRDSATPSDGSGVLSSQSTVDLSDKGSKQRRSPDDAVNVAQSAPAVRDAIPRLGKKPSRPIKRKNLQSFIDSIETVEPIIMVETVSDLPVETKDDVMVVTTDAGMYLVRENIGSLDDLKASVDWYHNIGLEIDGDFNGVEQPRVKYGTHAKGNPDQKGFDFEDEFLPPVSTYEQSHANPEQEANKFIKYLGRFGGSLLANRVTKDFEDRGLTNIIGQKVETPQDMAVVAQVYRHPAFETIRVILTKDGVVVGHTGLTSRRPSSVSVPNAKWWADDINKMAEKLGADGVWLTHNHPSGDPTPSDADVRLTEALKNKFGLKKLKGHVVTNTTAYAHIDSFGIVDNMLDLPRDFVAQYNPNLNATLEHELSGTNVMSPVKMAKAAKSLERPGFFTVIGASKGKVSGIMELPVAVLKRNPLYLQSLVRRFELQTGSQHSAVVGNFENDSVTKGILIDAVNNNVIMDGVQPNGYSLIQAGLVELRREGVREKSLKVAEEESRYDTYAEIVRPYSSKRFAMEKPIDKLFEGIYGLLAKKTGVDPMIRSLGKRGIEKAGDVISEQVLERFPASKNVVEMFRAGLQDRYGLSDDYIRRDEDREAEKRRLFLDTQHLIEKMSLIDVTNVAASRAFHKMLVNEGPTVKEYEALGKEITESIDNLSRRAISIGMLSKEDYAEHRHAYLHRVYKKYEADTGSGKVARMRAKNKKIIGDQMKGRGMTMKVDFARIMADNKVNDWGVKREKGLADRALWKKKVRVLDYYSTDNTLDANGQPKLVQRIYLQEGKPEPEIIGAVLKDRGTFVVRDTRGKNVTLWRDFTETERDDMGEITDARYTVARTMMLMAHDITTGEFYRDIAVNPEWVFSGDGNPPGTFAQGDEIKRPGLNTMTDWDWVKVPDSLIKDTNKKRYGALAGKFVRAEIYRDLMQVEESMQSSRMRWLMTQWKLNKTARNPVTHMNNVMSNIILMDLTGVTMRDLKEALNVILMPGKVKNGKADLSALADIVARLEGKQRNEELSTLEGKQLYDAQLKLFHYNLYQKAERSGALGASFIEQDIKAKTLTPILKELEKVLHDDKGFLESKLHKDIAFLGKWADAITGGIGKADQKMQDIYQMEDEVFRLAAFIRNLHNGMETREAGIKARDQFLNYDIRAPWVNAARRTVLPFAAYTYRAAPVLAKAFIERPWKLAKYLALSQIMKELFYSMAGSDEEEERNLLRPEEQGMTWFGIERMFRMPFDINDSPTFLDVRRFIPAGDIIDFEQGNIVVPWLPAPLQPGGPMMILAEAALNKSAFTGRKIVDPLIDTDLERFTKSAAWAWKAVAPSAPWVPMSYSWDKWWARATDVVKPGNKGNIYTDLASSFGIKLKPLDKDYIEAMQRNDKAARIRALGTALRSLNRQLNSHEIDQEEFDAAKQVLKEKHRRVMDTGRAN